MQRYLMTEQFLGALFANLVEKNVFQIELSRINELERNVNSSLMRAHDAMLYVSSHEIYTMVEEYDDFFVIHKNRIQLKEELILELIRDTDFKENFIYRLNRYFTSGIPNDINETVTKLIEKTVEMR